MSTRMLESDFEIDFTPLPRPAAPPAPDSALREVPGDVEIASADPANRFGRYVRVAFLGRGGMGEVWRAWDLELRRWVALKFPREEDEADLVFLRREAQLVAGLSHPNVAAMYELGMARGRHFIAMEYVDGATLHQAAGDDPRRIVELVRDAALGVAHAHRHGIVHRDLKPGNLLVDRGGRVFVTDFGIARRVSSRSGAPAGTPEYMSPEQLRGQAGGVRTDVYALGVSLYQLLERRLPFHASSHGEIRRLVLEEAPPPLRRADADLAAVVARCLDKNPARRYADAGEFAEALTRWLNAVPARTRFRRRALAAAALLLLAGAAAAAGFHLARERRERARAERSVALVSRVSPMLAEAETYARAGETARAAAKLRQAEAECRAALGRDEMPHARLLLARALAGLGRTDEAIRELDRASGLREARAARGLLLLREYDARAAEQWRANRRRGEPAAADGPELRSLRERVEADLAGAEGDVLFARAELARIRMRWSEAESLLETLLAQEPSHAPARLSLAKIARARGREDRAVELAGEVLQWHRGLAEAHLLRGDIYAFRALRLSGDPRHLELLRALADAERALALQESYEALELRARVHYVSGREEEGLRDLTRALDLRPDWAGGWMERGLLRSPRDPAGAIEDCDRALALDPNSAEAYMIRGIARLTRGEPDRALADFDRAIEVDASHFGAFLHRGRVHSMRGDHDQAIRDFTVSIRKYPRNAPALRSRAQAYQRKGLFSEALADYNRALQVEPNYAVTYLERGYLFLVLGQYSRAEGDYTRALALDPKTVGAWFHRGIVRERLRKLPESLSDFTRAIDLRPDWIEARVRRIGVLALMGRNSAVAEECALVLQLDPRCAPALDHRAEALCQLGVHPAAILDFTAAIALRPGSWMSWSGRGVARLRYGERAAAWEDFAQAAVLNPLAAEPLLGLGDLLWMSRNPRGALPYYAKAVALRPWHGPSRSRLADALIATGHRTQAKAEYREAFRLSAPGGSGRAHVERMLRRLE